MSVAAVMLDKDREPLKPRLIRDGNYIAEICGWHCYLYMGRRPKVALKVKIVRNVDGAATFCGTVLTRHWNVGRVDVCRHRFTASGWNSDLVRDFIRVTNHSIHRLDRIPMSLLKGLVECRVRAVKSDRDGDPLPEAAQYSLVAKLLGRPKNLDLNLNLNLASSSPHLGQHVSSPTPIPRRQEMACERDVAGGSAISDGKAARRRMLLAELRGAR